MVLKVNLLEILTKLIAEGKLKRGTKYPLSYLTREISKDFENGVPRQLSDHTAWIRISINGEPGYQFAGIISKLPRSREAANA